MPASSPRSDVLVLGAGAAGLFAAALAGQRGRRVTVLEGNARPGRKILISGGGRANFTNRDTRAENFLTANPHFPKSALARYTSADFLALLARHRVPWHEKTLGQLFCDRSAADLLTVLETECAAAGVAIRTETRITTADHGPDGFTVATSRGEFTAPVLIVASGGLSIPKIGATGLAFDLARRFGLAVEPTRPALVPLLVPGWEGLAGVSAPSIVTARRGPAFAEKLLFTHRGLSGPAILQASSYWRPGESITANLLPAGPEAAAWIARKQERAEARTILAETLPARLAERLAPAKPLARCADAELRQLAALLAAHPFTPTGTEGYEKAEVTAGGVSTRELSSQTMEARRLPGLFFIGEAVDVTGWLGGYNFQWAWSSAHAAAQAI